MPAWQCKVQPSHVRSLGLAIDRSLTPSTRWFEPSDVPRRTSSRNMHSFRASAALRLLVPYAARHACRTCRWRETQLDAVSFPRHFWSPRPKAYPQAKATGRGTAALPTEAALSTEAATQPCSVSDTLRTSSDDTTSLTQSSSTIWPGLGSWRALDADKRRQWKGVDCVEVQPEPHYLARRQSMFQSFRAQSTNIASCTCSVHRALVRDLGSAYLQHSQTIMNHLYFMPCHDTAW